MKSGNLLVILLFLLISCDTFLTPKKTSEEFLEEELKTINWNDVDTYPLFPNCDESDSKEQQKKCFESTLHRHINTHIQNEELISNKAVYDTLLINIEISGNSEVTISGIEGDSLTFAIFPELREHLYKSIKTLPKTEPALKRGVPVKTAFILPLILKSE
tara:strand:- start:12314 stop:12793 length:480 start_codon:yes stop_codon:yes gene_type:complete